MNNIEKDAHEKFDTLVIYANPQRLEDFKVFPRDLQRRVFRTWSNNQYRKIQLVKAEIDNPVLVLEMWCHIAWASVIYDFCEFYAWELWKTTAGQYYLDRLALILGFELTDADKLIAIDFALARMY